MAAGEDHREDVVHSEKIVTDETEKTEAYSFEDKNSRHHDEPWLQDSKDLKLDDEHQGRQHFENEDELDIAIVNDITSTEDDTTLKAFTFRAVLTGFCLAALSSSVAQLMLFKPVGIPLTNTFMIIVAYLFCTVWARVLPKGGWLNPGPFNVKEHVCIYVMVSSANHTAYGTYILSAQELFYADAPGPAGAIFLLFATQLVGYGIAGQLRPYLVYPSNMIWPAALPTISILKTFNTDAAEAKWRTKYFFIVFGAIFI